EAVDAHCAIAVGRGIRLEASAGGSLARVLADRERIAQVFSNLIGNALKFTPPGGRVALRVWRSSSVVSFAVEDTGPGITAGDRARVFDRFWQAKKSGAGTGLGLSIAKAIVEGHHGTIGVDSAPGRGSRFEFSLPIAESPTWVTLPAEPARQFVSVC